YGRLAVRTRVIRRRMHAYPGGTFRSDFARQLDADYRARLTGKDLFINELTLTLVWHPGRDPVERAAGFIAGFGRSRARGPAVESLKKLEDATRDAVAALAAYGPRRLGI